MQLKSFFIISLILCTLPISHSQLIIDDNYAQSVDNTIPEPTLIQIQNQTIEIETDATIPVYISSPDMISPIYYTHVQNKLGQNCTIEDIEPQKQYGDYIKFKADQMGKFQGWPVVILDAAYSVQTETVYAVLTNGSMIKAKLRKEVSGQGNHVEKFEMFDYLKTQTEAIWELDEYELFSTQGHIYLLKEKQLYKAVFSQNRKWGMEPLQNGQNINRVHFQNGTLFIIKNKNIHKIISQSVSPALLNTSQYSGEKIEFIDLDIDNGMMYLLCKSEGVVVLDMGKNYEQVTKYMFDFPQNAYRISVKANTILINFKLYRKTFIGEFFLIPSISKSSPASFKLNKFYYRFDEMHNVVLFENYGMVYSLSEINFFQHSINRNIPFGELQTSNIYTASYPKILDVIPLDQTNLHYILVQKNGIFVQSFGNVSQGSLLNSRLQCVFNQSGTYEIKAIYQGFCQHNMRSTQAYCSKNQTYIFYVNDQKEKRQVQAFNDHLFVGLILAVAFVLVLGAILAYRKITLENREKLNTLLAEKRKFNEMNSVKVESETANSKKSELQKQSRKTVN